MATKYYKKPLQQNLDCHTLQEILDLYKIDKKELNALLQKFNLSVKYKYRTPVTNQLIPIDSMISKELDKRKKAVKGINSSWRQNELKIRQKCRDEASVNIGALLFRIEQATEELNKFYHDLAYQEFMINVLQNLDSYDIIGVMSEEQYGKYDIPKYINEHNLNDSVLFSYLGLKYGLSQALKIKHVLEGSN